MKEITCPLLFVHGQKDNLIPFEQTIQLKEACHCPYEVVLPEEMDHNLIDYELDMIIPMKNFFLRHTAYKEADISDVEIYPEYFDTPKIVIEYIESLKGKNDCKKNTSCFCGNTDPKDEK